MTDLNKSAARRIIGIGFDNKPIFAPKPSHSLLMAAAGSRKTTCGAMPSLMSLIEDRSRAVIVNDGKDGEVAAQCADTCHAHGRKVAIVDDGRVLGRDNPYRVSLTPFGGVISAHDADKGELVFATENANHALIAEPPNDARNQYWRDEPRSYIEFALRALLKRGTHLAIPGGVWSLLASPTTFLNAARIEAEDGDETLAALGSHILDAAANNKEHFSQHRGAALRALRIYSAGSWLHTAGVDAEISHAELIRQKYVIFIVGPQRHMGRLGPHYALHLQSFVEALLSGEAGPVDFILDEFTNAPLQALVAALTTMRGYGGNCHMIAQSRSEIQRKYGEKETATIEENAVVKQWFGFSSFEEAERVSRAMGEGRVVQHGLGYNSGQLDYSGNLSTSKERLFTAEQLMRLPVDEQIIHVKDVGFIHCRKIGQNQIAPYCHELADNPLEGGRLPADPLITLGSRKGTRS
ncbi:MAG: type IV secretory system conjugative DNA transfer family protein [Geminicoccaceae bacterium]|nr:type IV secretory system conjugative DNA transfer family protein [Geminicoccaceae bacterium]